MVLLETLIRNHKETFVLKDTIICDDFTGGSINTVKREDNHYIDSRVKESWSRSQLSSEKLKRLDDPLL